MNQTSTSTHTMNVGRVERLAFGGLGAGLALSGIVAMLGRRRWSPLHLGLAAAGMTLLRRGMTGYCPAYAALGLNTAGDSSDTRVALGGSAGIRVEESVAINAPVADLYRFWRDLTNLPRFMEHLEEVRLLPGNRSHWVARGPAGSTVEWDAEIMSDVENKLISWRSVGDADVVSAGSVNFEETSDGLGTRLRVLLQYHPPGGRLGAAVARLFGEEPARQIREDLDRLRRLLESGETAGPPH